jgi:hypothetical protein
MSTNGEKVESRQIKNGNRPDEILDAPNPA